MASTLALIAFFLIVICTWFVGLWNNVITFVNTILAALIASNYFEPLADRLDGGQSTYTYLLDFIALWLLFFLSFVVLHTSTDLLGRYRLHFNIWVDRVGRTVFSVATAWVFVCFMMFTLHTAPLPVGVDSFQERPDTVNFVGSPDRLWLGFLQSRSRGALSASLDAFGAAEYDTRLLHPDDIDLKSRVFDSTSDFIYKYRHRRVQLGSQESLRVNR